MNKRVKEIQDTIEEWESAYRDYTTEADAWKEVTEELYSKYSKAISQINASRADLRKEIDQLYQFLSIWNIGRKITPFDYQLEFSSRIYLPKETCPNTIEQVKNRIGNRFDAVSVVFGILGEAVGLLMIPSKLKSALQEITEGYQKEQLKWEHDKSERKSEYEFYNVAAQIADIYMRIIMSTQDIIRETIIPELSGIQSFLYADAVANCVIENQNPVNARISNIEEYKGTLYHQHYLFVRNVFDYYQIMVRFFTKPILRNLVENDIDKQNEYIQEERNKIEEKIKEIKGNVFFGGGK